jgi:PIN domain nuclease of toxin-antitoxin system
METFTPLVISSKAARKDFEKIKKHATEIIQRHKDHVVRVSAYHEKLRAEKMDKMQRNNEARKSMQEQEAKNRDVQMAHQIKMRELEIKNRA